MAPAKHIHIEAIQTVTPAKACEPGQSRKVSSPIPSDLLQSHHRLVACYKRAGDEEVDESGHALGGWFKESLNVALGEQPVFAGRLRQEEDGKGEVRFSDAGLRLVQAQAEVSLDEFLELKGVDEREDLLAYWADVDHNNVHYSALCYVQVTNFKGEGYSIGISCSLLLADTIFLLNFLRTWADIHTTMLNSNRFAATPVFYLTKLKRPSAAPLASAPLDHSPSPPANRTTLLHVPDRTTAALCHGEFYVITRGAAGEVEVENHVGEAEMEVGGGVGVLDVVREEELWFGEGNKPVSVSYNVRCGKGVVQVMARDSGLCAVTVVNKV